VSGSSSLFVILLVRSACSFLHSGRQRSITELSFCQRATRHLPRSVVLSQGQHLCYRWDLEPPGPHPPRSRVQKFSGTITASRSGTTPNRRDRRRPDHLLASTPPGPTAGEQPKAGGPRAPTMPGCFRGCRAASREATAFVQSDVRRILPRQSATGHDDDRPTFRPHRIVVCGLASGRAVRGHADLPHPGDREQELICPNRRSRRPFPAQWRIRRSKG
jgi:hypothetical protein